MGDSSGSVILNLVRNAACSFRRVRGGMDGDGVPSSVGPSSLVVVGLAASRRGRWRDTGVGGGAVLPWLLLEQSANQLKGLKLAPSQQAREAELYPARLNHARITVSPNGMALSSGQTSLTQTWPGAQGEPPS